MFGVSGVSRAELPMRVMTRHTRGSACRAGLHIGTGPKSGLNGGLCPKKENTEIANGQPTEIHLSLFPYTILFSLILLECLLGIL
ncbi:hypothetical protein MRB53_017838 [Persea americana]|uniref:Uncharacterized protein n=1 Tax=Persea americana TaxID=3435 RepID=A0ACC2M740_PERAE|nr:hypothetical protein MRB53_017838 [Persea americana]